MQYYMLISDLLQVGGNFLPAFVGGRQTGPG